MRRTIIIGDTQADIDAAPAGEVERATLALLAESSGLRVFRSRPRGLEDRTYPSIDDATRAVLVHEATEKMR